MRNFFLISSTLLIVGILGRVIPHPPNFTPIGGIIIFSTLKIENTFGKIFIPLFVFWVSDLIINNVMLPNTYPQYYQGFQLFGNWTIYLALIVIMTVLRFYFHNYSSYILPGASLISATLFFLISNFGVWLGSSIYTPNFSGFLICLGAGVPFFGNTLLSTLIYSVILVKGYDFLYKDYGAKNYFN